MSPDPLAIRVVRLLPGKIMLEQTEPNGLRWQIIVADESVKPLIEMLQSVMNDEDTK